MDRPPAAPSHWYRSFAWRIGIGFVAFVLVLLAAQSLMFGYLLSRARGPFAPMRPNAAAVAVAARLSRSLTAETARPLDALVREAAGDTRQRTYLVTPDGRVGANTTEPLEPHLLGEATAILAMREPPPDTSPDPAAPAITAPVHADGRLLGLLVMPPPPRRSVLSEAGALLTLPGSIGLLVLAAVAGALVFRPARVRLQALETAALDLGGGNLDARAPEGGHDEIARVAGAFNQMARDLARRSEALQVSNDLRRRLLADVSHELRTPLTAMRGFLDTLALSHAALDADTHDRYLATVRREAARLERIVEDLLDLARHEQAALTLDVRVCDVGRIFDQVRQRHERDAAEADVRITVDVARGADQILADPDRLHQVIGNLVANALGHTPPGGTITLSASADGTTARLAVGDTGRGIAPEHLPHVFERFYKVDDARRAGQGGSGLGLSIVKAIVERHGGRVSVASEPGGTTFVVELPRGIALADA